MAALASGFLETREFLLNQFDRIRFQFLVIAITAFYLMVGDSTVFLNDDTDYDATVTCLGIDLIEIYRQELCHFRISARRYCYAFNDHEDGFFLIYGFLSGRFFGCRLFRSNFLCGLFLCEGIGDFRSQRIRLKGFFYLDSSGFFHFRLNGFDGLGLFCLLVRCSGFGITCNERHCDDS